jgi:hypothetical protein
MVEIIHDSYAPNESRFWPLIGDSIATSRSRSVLAGPAGSGMAKIRRCG